MNGFRGLKDFPVIVQNVKTGNGILKEKIKKWRNMKKLKIDDEFSKLIPPLQPDEFNGLKESILKEGCRDSLVVWAETGILVDGHNRYRICTENNIEFHTSKKSFEDRDEVILWIINNQMGRRNLLPIDRVPMMERAQTILAKQARERQATSGEGVFGGKPLMEIFPEAVQGTTRDQLGAQIGISGKTFGALSKVNQDGIPELVEAVRNKVISAENAARLATLSADEQRNIVSQGRNEMLIKAKEIKESKRKSHISLTKEDHPHSDADLFVDVAISHLKQIRHDDPLKRKALDRLIQWITEYRNKRR